MKRKPAARPAANSRKTVTLELAGQQQLQVATRDRRSLLRLVGPDGKVRLRIEVSPAGPVLHVDGQGLRVEVHGELALAADRLAVVGRRELALVSGGDLHLRAKGDLHSQARVQNVTADLGNVNVKANDDVRLNGERVMVNCDD